MIRDPKTLKWKNSKAFSEVGRNFIEKGYYCPDPWGSPAWYDFWDRESDRCEFGYKIGKWGITGAHYFYLNYVMIEKIDVVNAVGRVAKKIQGLPDFWDGDYEYFWVREIARDGVLVCTGATDKELAAFEKKTSKQKLKELKRRLNIIGFRHFKLVISEENLLGGKDLIIGKARRRGFSYKNSSIGSRNFFLLPSKLTMYMAYEKKYLYPGIKTIFGKTKHIINHVNANTAWRMPSDEINKQNHIKASYIEYVGGQPMTKGMLSEIEAISFKDNPDAGRGADAYDIVGEEVGAWGTPGGLKKTIAAMRSSTEGGIYKVGMMTLFGTSGDIEGGTADFADLFSRPGANNFLKFYDVWGDNPNVEEGFFFPKHLNTEGFYDEQGNSDTKGAKKQELEKRLKLIKGGATSIEIAKRMQEEPLNSQEAFAMISLNKFPVVELNKRLRYLKATNLHMTMSTPVTLEYVDANKDKVKARPILSGKANPIMSLKDLPLDPSGEVVIYEHPITNPPPGLYKIGYDPVMHDDGTSLVSIVVYKSYHRGSRYYSTIVAEYIGRRSSPEDIDELALKLSILYNTKVMFENNVPGTKNYFLKRKKLHRLALQPDRVIAKNIKKSSVARVYGCHMNIQLKQAGERYTMEWLNNVINYDEDQTPITVIDQIYSIRLLEELIAYNPLRGNFDLVSALFMCMIQKEEEPLEKEYQDQRVNVTAMKLMEQLKVA